MTTILSGQGTSVPSRIFNNKQRALTAHFILCVYKFNSPGKPGELNFYPS